MAPPTKDTEQITFRLPKEWLKKADWLAVFISRPGMPASRTDALRYLIARGFQAIEDEEMAEHVALWRSDVEGAVTTMCDYMMGRPDYPKTNAMIASLRRSGFDIAKLDPRLVAEAKKEVEPVAAEMASEPVAEPRALAMLRALASMVSGNAKSAPKKKGGAKIR